MTRTQQAYKRFITARLKIQFERYIQDVGVEAATTRGFHQWSLAHPEEN